MDRELESIIDDIIDKIEWDFYYNTYLPGTEKIKELFNEIEYNYETFKNTGKSES
jgi:hypothetical protein